LGDWIMRDSEGNPVDTNSLSAARQEGYAQGWKDAVTNMITAANNMQHPKMDVSDAATVSNPLPVAAHAAQAGGPLTNSPGGSDSQLQYNNAGAFGGTAGLTWNPAVPTTVATSLRLVNETNTPADLDPRGMVSQENSDTDHSAHFTGRKSRGTAASQAVVQVGDYLAGFTCHGYNGTDYERAGYYSHFVTSVLGGHLSTNAEIRVSSSGVELAVYDATNTDTTVNGALRVNDNFTTGYASITLKGTQSGDATNGWGVFSGHPNPGDFTIRERTVADYLTIKRTTGDIINWQGRLMFGGTTPSFPALKRSTTTLQARLADDSAFAPLQGKLTTDAAFTAGPTAATGYLTIYDSTGTAYKVNATPA
jgi:hypothetical protein